MTNACIPLEKDIAYLLLSEKISFCIVLKSSPLTETG